MIAALSVYAEDIGGLGLNFLFPSHDALARAKLELSNVTHPGITRTPKYSIFNSTFSK